MARFASNKRAFGYSERSGFRYDLKDMRKEWNGLTVGYDEYETKHPQLEPIRVSPDPQALRNPKPRVEFMDATVEFPIFDLQTIKYKDKLFLQSELGSVTVSTS
tara:strand:+ start:629 stop:940 length:312 start_codon:yes stop_codon:yes gene_type:complete